MIDEFSPLLAFSLPRLFACSSVRSLFWLSSAGLFSLGPFGACSFCRSALFCTRLLRCSKLAGAPQQPTWRTVMSVLCHSFARPLCWAALSHARLVCARLVCFMRRLFWRLATPGAQGSPAISRSGDQPPWPSDTPALDHSGATLHVFVYIFHSCVQ